jgi:drug/metabolite transporter (DMT)-like permease
MSYILFAWIADFSYALEVVLMKLTSKYGIKNPWSFNFLWNIVLVLIMMPIALINGLSFPSHWWNIFMSGMTCALFTAIYVYCFYQLDVSIASPLFNIRTIFALLFGVILLGEKIQNWQYPLILIIFIAGFFATYDEKFSLKSFFNKNVVLLIFAMAIFAIYSVFLNRSIAEVGFWNATFWNMVFIPIFLIPTFPFFKKDLHKIRSKQIGALFAISFVGVGGVIMSNIAFAENIGMTSVILSVPLSMIMVILLSTIWPSLLEKHTKKVYVVRLISAFVMILCALKLSS